MDNKLPIVVFNMEVPGNVLRAAMGENVGRWCARFKVVYWFLWFVKRGRGMMFCPSQPSATTALTSSGDHTAWRGRDTACVERAQ
jgi:hypothetical protein